MQPVDIGSTTSVAGLGQRRLSCLLLAACRVLLTRFFFFGDPFLSGRCPLLAIPTAIMYAVEESEGQTGSFVPRITGCAILLLAFVIASRSVLPVAMARLVLKDKTKVRG